MDAQIEEFNVDVGVFLRKLQHFAAASKQINVSTANLLAETISGIENLLEDVDIKADESEAAQQNDVFAKFDGEIYKLQHYAACRLCNTSFHLNQLQKHNTSVKHQKALSLSAEPVPLQSNATNHEAKVETPKAVTDVTAVDEPMLIRNAKMMLEQKLLEMFRPIGISHTIRRMSIDVETEHLITHNKQDKIIEVLRSAYDNFDATKSLEFIKYGSRCYGIGASGSDLNIFIDQRDCAKSPFFIAEILKKLIKMEFKKHFELVKLDDGDNGMEKMVRIVHKDSKINCTLVIGSDRSVASSKLLHDYLATHPICRSIVLFLKSWHAITNEMIADEFHFNTYIWTTLVVTRFQFRNVEPKLADVERLAKILPQSAFSEANRFKASAHLPQITEELLDFFTFYGNKFNYKTHILSAHIGRLQEKRQYCNTEPADGNVKKRFSQEQANLKKSIGNNPAAWKDDMLWLQDLNKSNENAAANIPTKEIIAFQQMCKLSAKFLEYIKSESATATM